MESENTHTDADVDDLVTEVHRNYREARDATDEWRGEARLCFRMEAGDQWDAEDRTRMQGEDRVPVTFNRIARAVNVIVGAQIQSRQETRFLPREMGDVSVAENYSAAAEWARDDCDAEDEETDAFRDMVISGMGWTESRLDYEEHPDGTLPIERVDPLWMYWDPSARRKNLTDRRWQLLVKRIPISEFEERWPDVELAAASSPWDEEDEDESGPRTHVYPQDAYRDGQLTGRQNDTIRVGHYQYFEREEIYRVGPQAVEFTADKFSKIRDKLDEMGIRYVRQTRRRYKEAFIAGNLVLEEGDCPVNGFTFQCMTGTRNRTDGTWKGLVHLMVDPQRWGNKFFSQILDILNKNAKGGVIAERTAVDDVREVEEKWARPDSVVWVNDGAISQKKIMPKPLGEYPAGLDKLMQYAMDSVTDVPGISMEILGMTDRSQPGVLEFQRKQAGMTLLAPYFDALRMYRKTQGRIYLEFIEKYISDGRLIRIMGQNGNEQYIPLMKQEGTREYDIIVDESPTSPNQRERVFASLVQMMPTLGKMGVPMPKEILDYSPIPSKLAQSWKAEIERAKQNKVPPEVQMAIAERDKMIARLNEDNRKLKDKREEAAANLMLKKEEMDAKRQMNSEELQQKFDEMRAELEMSRIKHREEAELARDKAVEEAMLKRQQAEDDLAVEFAKLQIQQSEKTNMDAQNKALVQKAIEDAVSRVVSNKPRRKVTVNRDQDGLITDAVVEDLLDMEPAGNG